jgi:hypothetical protein
MDTYLWRFNIINHLIQKNGYTKYLEIGVEDGDNIRQIQCELKHGVDPASEHATFKMPSDDFFDGMRNGSIPTEKYDIVFVDGLHVEEQSTRDVLNSLEFLNENGTIVMHDCNPPSEWHQRSYEEAKQNGCRNWNGRVWASIVWLRSNRDDLEVSVVDTDWGCGIVRKCEAGKGNKLDIKWPVTYKQMDANRCEMLNLISPMEFMMRY